MYLYILSLILILSSQTISAQTIEGNVFDFSDKNKLELTDVFIKGKKIGSVTDSNGKYSFQRDSDSNIVLIYSSIGYLKTIIEIRNISPTQNINMPDVYLLEDKLSTMSVLSMSGDSINCTDIPPSELDKKLFYKLVDDIIEFYNSNNHLLTECKVIDNKFVFMSIDYNKQK